MDQTAEFYSRPSYNYRGAGGFPIFSGSRRQRGGGIFGSLKSFFTPIAKKVGKKLMKHGIGLATDVAKDALLGKNMKDSLLTHGKARAKNIGRAVANEGLSVVGNLMGNSKKSNKSKQTKRLKRKGAGKRVQKKGKHHTSRKRASCKRPAKRSSSYKPKAKRRRIAANF